MADDPITQSAEAVTEGAKAAQEIAKTTRTGLEMVRDSSSWVARMLGPVAEGLAGTLKDRTDLFRAMNFVKLHQKWERFRVERGLAESDWRDVSPTLLLPALDAASLEDEDELQTVWARLLTASTDPNCPPVRRTYMEIAKQLEVIYARLLEYFNFLWDFRKWYKNRQRTVNENKNFDQIDDGIYLRVPRDVFAVDVRAFAGVNGLSLADLNEPLDNLQRLGCLIPMKSPPSESWRLTSLCLGFFCACYGSNNMTGSAKLLETYYWPLRMASESES